MSWMTAAALAIVAVMYSPVLPSRPVLTVFAFLLIIVALYCRKRKAVIPLIAVLAGASYAAEFGQFRLAQQWPNLLAGQDVNASIEVLSQPELRSGERIQYRFDAGLAAGQCFGEGFCPPGRPLLRLNWYAENPPPIGSEVQLRLRLWPPDGVHSPGAFDYRRWLWSQGYAATGYVRSANLQPDNTSRLATEPSQAVSLFSVLRVMRSEILQHFAEVLTVFPQAGVMRALLFADKSAVETSQWRVFSASGTSHLMAISGMHLSIVFAWVACLAQPLSLVGRGGLGVTKWVYLSGLLCAAAYAALAGFGLPTQRALLMLSVLVLGLGASKLVSSWNAYFAAMLVVLLFNPLASHSAGFWLSFGAVGVLLYSHPLRRPAPRWAIFRAQVLVILGLLPLTLAWGFGTSLVAIPANLVAIPVLGVLIMPLLFIGLLSEALIPPLAHLAFSAADLVLNLLQGWLGWLVSWTPNWQPVSSLWIVLLIALLVLGLLLPRGLPGKGLMVLALLALLTWPYSRPKPGYTQLTVFDVGQGLAVLIQTHKHSLLYDTGPDFDSGFNSFDSVIAPYLRGRGITSLDALVVSHGDRDHAGALAALLAWQSPNAILSGEPQRIIAQLREAGLSMASVVELRSCHDSSVLPWEWDGVSFKFIQPAPGSSRDESALQGNNASCVMRIRIGRRQVLLTGDIARDREQTLLSEKHEHLLSEVLIAPHHGSASSSSPDFIEAVAPNWVVFSAARHNRYGHPAKAVVARYAKIQSHCYATGYHGTLSFELGPDGIQLQGLGRRKRFFWEWTYPEMCRNPTKPQ